jgi:hypothetical protein
MEGEKKIKLGEFVQGISRTKPNGFSKKNKIAQQWFKPSGMQVKLLPTHYQ